MVRCPACGSLLFRRRLGGIDVDGCPGCGGSFFDGGELKALFARPDALREVDRQFVPGLQPTLEPIRTDACPRCGQELVRYQPPSLGGSLEVQGCRGCGGIWLDHGEPTAVAKRVSPGTDAGPASPGPGAPTGPRTAPTAPAGARTSPTAARIAAVLGDAPAPVATAAAPAVAGYAPAAAVAGYAPAIAGPSADPTRTGGLPVVRGRRLAGPVAEGGLWGGLTRGLRFFQTAFGLAAECPRLFAPLLAGALVQAALLSALVYWLFTKLRENAAAGAAATWGPESVVPWLHAHGFVLPVAVVLLGFVGHLINLVVLGVTVSMVDAYLKGRDPRFGVAVRDVAKNLGGIVALAAVGTLVSLLAGAIRGAGNRRGLGGLVVRPMANGIANLIETVWTVLGFLLLPVIVIEDVGLRAALDRVRAIHRGSLLPIAVGEVGLRAVSALGGLLFVIGLVGLGLLLWPLTPGDLRGLVVFAILVGSVGGAAAAYLRGAYYTCLYLWAAETERAGDPALATVPAPLAEVLT
jgi:Zn-finger nucleic acid-binding protein